MVELIPKKRLLLVDGNNIAWRWFMSHQGKQLSTSNGVVTTTCYGMIESIIKANNALEEAIFRNTSVFRPSPYDKVVICWDSPKNWRKQVDPEYKATRNDPKRSLLKEEISVHLMNAKNFFSAIHLPQMEVDWLEADDVIGMVTETYKQSDWTVTIVSGDHDLHQLLDWGRVMIHNGEDQLFDESWFISQYGIRASRWCEAKAIMGDSGDNVVGVRGIGKTLSTRIIKAFSKNIREMKPEDIDSLPKISRFNDDAKSATKEAISAGVIEKNARLVTIPRHHNVLGREVEDAFMNEWGKMQRTQQIAPTTFVQVLEMYEMNKHLHNYKTVMSSLGLS